MELSILKDTKVYTDHIKKYLSNVSVMIKDINLQGVVLSFSLLDLNFCIDPVEITVAYSDLEEFIKLVSSHSRKPTPITYEGYMKDEVAALAEELGYKFFTSFSK